MRTNMCLLKEARKLMLFEKMLKVQSAKCFITLSTE